MIIVNTIILKLIKLLNSTSVTIVTLEVFKIPLLCHSKECYELNI